MSSKQLSILVIFITLGFCEPQNWCEFVTPNNKYSGLGIYHRFIHQKKHDDSLIMYNRAASQWKFKTYYDPNSDNYAIDMIKGSLETTDKDFIDRFGIIEHSGNMTLDCIIKLQKGEHNTTCITFNKLTKSWGEAHFLSKFPDKIVLLNPWPKNSEEGNKEKNISLIFNKNNRKEYWLYTDLETHKCDQNTKAIYTKLCQTIPKWVEKMDNRLFGSIEGIISLSVSDNSRPVSQGYLILFFIDEVTKYCFNFDEEELSNGCKTSKKLKVVFKECFSGDFWSPTPTQFKESNALIIFVLFVVILVFIGLIASVIIWLFISRKGSQSIEEKPNTINL